MEGGAAAVSAAGNKMKAAGNFTAGGLQTIISSFYISFLTCAQRVCTASGSVSV